ncbi:histidine kinase [Oceanidesulfovibrio indonesiensis]|uniref:histidine kinase n=1 Tax=Oceanidesulfovibrio indonesiensis TaxID=54767 RepID=A0A7M3MGV4_9BACT|nr:response regulator [Oceanidesulfovibrio indonesiensis]TVM18300.1 histidine kinase [Oceanidesulfovibrio indonesiensis]
MDVRKLMLVDDEEGIRRFLGLSLQDMGYEVETAANGQEALELFEQFKPPIVLTDIKMPVMDGIELLRRLKEISPDTEVVIISGHGDLELAIEALKNDAADFITKPINNDVLEISLERLCERIGMKRQLREYTENLEHLVEEKTQRIIDLERETAACRVVEGLSTALSNVANQVEKESGLFNELPCLVSVHNRNQEIVAANALFKQRLGEFIGQKSYSIFEGRGAECVDCPVRKTFATGKGQHSKEVVVSETGERIPVTVYTAPIHNTEGNLDLVLEISVDMTELSRLKEELLATQLKFQRLFDEAPCYISVQNPDLTIAEVNRRFDEDFPDAAGRYCYEVYKHRGAPCHECLVNKTLEDGESHQMETVVTTAKGEQKNILVWSAPIRNAFGEITQVMEMSTDITEIRRLQDHLTSLGIMLGSMSHGVKGMLTALDGGVYRLESGLRRKDQDRIEQAMDTLKHMINRIKKMILDILYYAKSRALDSEEVDAAEFLNGVAALIKDKAESAGIAYECDIPSGLGAMEVDSSAFSAALVNFLENAVDACESRRNGPPVISFRAAGNGDEIEITIEDNGMGMDRETRDKIFTLFFSSKGKKGTGLGLFISNQTIEQHGGAISVESELDKGSKFVITMPRQLPDHVRQAHHLQEECGQE